MTAVNSYIDVEIFGADSAWHSLAGTETSVEFTRGNRPDVADEMEIGTLGIETAGDAWSPVTNTNVRPRKPVRVKGLDGSATWRDLWYGTLETPSSRYAKNGPQVTRFSAFDVIGTLQRQKHNTGVLGQGSGSLADQYTFALAPKNGYGPAVTVVPVIPFAGSQTFGNVIVPNVPSVYDLVERTRNNWIGSSAQLWASRDAHRQLKGVGSSTNDDSSGSLPRFFTDQIESPNAEGPPTYYTDIEIGHSAEWFKNGVTFEDYSTAQTAGAYVDTTTTTEWGRNDIVIRRRARTGSPFATDADFAQAFLNRQPAPGVQVRSVTFDVLKNRALLAIDPLYRKVRIKHNSSGHNAFYLITKERHVVTPESWFVTYDVRPATWRNTPTPTLVA